MPENAKKPQIRFKGFTDAWEQRKLNEINTFFTDGNYGEAYPKQSDLSDSTNGIPFLTGGNLKNGILDLTGASYITKEKHKKLMSGHLLEDDIVIAVRGSLGALGYVTKKNVDWNINSQLAILRTDKERLIGSFLIQYLLSENAQNDFLSLMTGSALKQLPISQLKNLVVPVTLIHEQELIAQLFNRVDNLITLRQRKLDKLKNIKKSMLEKMFPKNGSNVPEIRFKGFTDAWEQRKLGEIANKVLDKNIGLQYVETLTNSAEYGIISQREFFDHNISKIESLEGYYIVQNNDFVYNPRISTTAPVGPINRNKLGRSGVMSPLYTVFRVANVDFTFLEYFFKTNCWHAFMNYNGDSGARSDRFSIKDNIFFEMPIVIPRIEEQIKIGKYMLKLDNLITLHQRKLEKLQNIKKACLEKMFV